MGSGCTRTCPQSGFEYRSATGIGYMFPLVYAETVQKAKSGELGIELQEFFLEHEDGAINAERVDLCCEDCGYLSCKRDLTMYVPDEKKIAKMEQDPRTAGMYRKDAKYVTTYDLELFYTEYAKYPHKCEKCGGKMKVMEHNTELMCPKCKVPLETSRIYCWD